MTGKSDLFFFQFRALPNHSKILLSTQLHGRHFITMGRDLRRADSQEKTTTAEFAEFPPEAQPSKASSYPQYSFKTLRSFYSSLREMGFLQRAKDLLVDAVAVDFELTSDDFADVD